MKTAFIRSLPHHPAQDCMVDKKYPEAMRVGKNGQRNHHGVRHNHCMSSPEYRKKTALMDKLLAEKFGQHPGLIMWHVSNELGGECYCPLCVERFSEVPERAVLIMKSTN